MIGYDFPASFVSAGPKCPLCGEIGIYNPMWVLPGDVACTNPYCDVRTFRPPSIYSMTKEVVAGLVRDNCDRQNFTWEI